jgi:hypothetical protein
MLGHKVVNMKHDREIRQLWDVAVEYCDAAKALLKSNPNYRRYRSSRIALFYERGIPVDKSQREPNIILGHLSSAAVRLCTIEERFWEDHRCRITKPYKAEAERTSNQNQIKIALVKNKDIYIHQLLRQNVAHIERARKGGALWHTRQEALESLKVEEILQSMQKVMDKFRKELAGKRII